MISVESFGKWNWLWVCLLTGFLAGCGSDKQWQKVEYSDAETGLSPVIACDTLFYKTGPQQAAPPDGEFKAGTKVEILGKAGSYTLVRTEDGRQGYVTVNAVAIPMDSH